MTAYDFVAFFAMAVVLCGVVYLVISLGDLPASIAKGRNHPQVASVRVMAWFGLLFTGGVVYILALAWAYYDYSMDSAPSNADASEIEQLHRQVAELRAEMARQGGAS